MLRRYCPPTLNSASVIYPKRATLTGPINSSKTLPFNLATSCNCLSERVLTLIRFQKGEHLPRGLLDNLSHLFR